MPTVTDYTALLGGNYWSGIEVTGRPTIVTYSFPAAGPAYNSSVPGFTGATLASFQAFTPAQQAQARAAMAEWAAVSGVIFLEVAPGQGDINFQSVDLNTTAQYAGAGGIGFEPFGAWDVFSYPQFNDDLTYAGDVYMNTQFISGGVINYGTLLHEIGHVLGLKHPTEIRDNTAAEPDVRHDEVLAFDDPALTIMATAGGTATLKQLDIDAAAFIYGASAGSVVTGDSSGSNAVVASWSWNAAAMTLTQTGFDAGDDIIRGTSVIDIMSGLGGDDRLFGLAGNDTLFGGGGNDALFGGSGADDMTGGAGDDSYYADNAADVIHEVAGGGFDYVYSSVNVTLSADLDYLQLFGAGLTGTGNALANTIFGDGAFGNTLNGMGGGDYIGGGEGADTISGGNDGDILYGGGGDDTLYGGDGGDAVEGGAGADILNGGLGTDTVNFVSATTVVIVHLDTPTQYSQTGSGPGGAIETDTLISIENVTTGEGADYVYGSSGDNFITTNAGNDAIYAGVGDDTIFAGTERDYAEGSYGGDYIDLNAGDDKAYGGANNDFIYGGDGRDSLYGDHGADQLFGGNGIDVLFVDSTDTVYDGGAGIDYIVWQDVTVAANLDVTAHSADYFYGYTGNDIVTATGAASRAELHGGGGNDTLSGSSTVGSILLGEAGDDTLIGNSGIDHMVGGTGADRYVFAGNGGTDYVYDFKTGGADKVDFTALAGAGVHGLGDLTVITAYSGGGWYGYGYGTGTVWLNVTASGSGQPAAGDFLFA